MEHISLLSWITIIGVIATIISTVIAILHYRHDKSVGRNAGYPAGMSDTEDPDSLREEESEFKLSDDLVTRVYCGVPKNFIARIFYDETVSTYNPSRENTAFIVRNFDWDGNFDVIRPCDIHLGFDRWDFREKRHTEHFEYSQESLGTLYAILLPSGVIFGNFKTVVFKPEYYKSFQALPLKLDSTMKWFGATRDRKVIAVITNKGGTLSVIRDTLSSKVEIQQVPANLSGNTLFCGVYFHPFNGPVKAFYAYQFQVDMEDHGQQILSRYDFDSLEITHSIGIEGLQNIAQRPDMKHLTAISKTELIIMDARDLRIIRKIPLSLARDREKYVCPPIQYSPCGRYLAYSYALTGDIEIVDANTFEHLHSFISNGIPASPIKWSADGRFLAAGFSFRNGKNNQLHIWNVQQARLVTKIDGLRLFDANVQHSEHPGNFYWHNSRYEIMVLKENGHIQNFRYVSPNVSRD